jgi:hypothetical protein
MGASAESLMIVKMHAMLSRWRYGAGEDTVRQALLIKAVLTWQHQQLAMALRTWRIESAIGVGMVRLYRWVSFHWVLREKSWALRMLRFAAAQHRTATKATLYWRNAQVHAAFDTWRETTQYELRKFQQSAMHRVLGHWQHRHLSAAFNTWYSKAMQLAWEQQQLYRGACLWSRQGAVKALNTWRAQTELLLLQTERFYKAMVRWAHSQLFAAFNSWLAMVEGERAHEMMLIASQHFRYASLFEVLDHWRDLVQAESGLHHDNYKADSHRNYSAMRAYLDLWKEDWSEWRKNSAVEEVDQSDERLVLAKACEPYGMFQLGITGTKYGKTDRALYYRLEVMFQGRETYELEKRYKDFDSLNSILHDRYKAEELSGAAFPPKKPFTKLNPEFYESRAHDLHLFLQNIITKPAIAASPELCEFLEFNQHFEF